MALSDDDKDFLPSLSSDEAFTHADRGKAKAMREKLKEEVGALQESQINDSDLSSKNNLKELKQQLTGKQDEEMRRKKEEEQQAETESTAPKTESLKEREESAEQTAYDNVSPDELIKQKQREPEVTDEESQAQPG